MSLDQPIPPTDPPPDDDANPDTGTTTKTGRKDEPDPTKKQDL